MLLRGNRLKYLLEKWYYKTSTFAEEAELAELLKNSTDENLEGLIKEFWMKMPEYPADRSIAANAMAEQILSYTAAEDEMELCAPVIRFYNRAWIRYAAIILLVLGTGTWLLLKNGPSDNKTQLAQTASSKSDLPPGGNKAVLTLADGTNILLDNAANGNVAEQGNAKILKLDAGSLSYNAAGYSASKEVMYNTITTPRGGLFHVILPDGSAAWLNAASSIRFPASFPANERRITVEGEVYLEIAKDKNRPFLINTHSSEIKVLGTSFNINSYKNELFDATTLFEGSIQILHGSSTNLLLPGQRIRIDKKGSVELDSNVATEEVIAWKKGLFYFNNVDLEMLLRQLSRWYDIDVVYEKGIRANEVIYGKMERSLTLSEVLEGLEGLGDLGVHFRLEGKKLIVLP